MFLFFLRAMGSSQGDKLILYLQFKKGNFHLENESVEKYREWKKCILINSCRYVNTLMHEQIPKNSYYIFSCWLRPCPSSFPMESFSFFHIFLLFETLEVVVHMSPFPPLIFPHPSLPPSIYLHLPTQCLVSIGRIIFIFPFKS